MIVAVRKIASRSRNALKRNETAKRRIYQIKYINGDVRCRVRSQLKQKWHCNVKYGQIAHKWSIQLQLKAHQLSIKIEFADIYMTATNTTTQFLLLRTIDFENKNV